MSFPRRVRRLFRGAAKRAKDASNLDRPRHSVNARDVNIERLPVDELHREIPSLFVVSERDGNDETGMTERPCRVRFVLQVRDGRGVRRVDYLQGVKVT